MLRPPSPLPPDVDDGPRILRLTASALFEQARTRTKKRLKKAPAEARALLAKSLSPELAKALETLIVDLAVEATTMALEGSARVLASHALHLEGVEMDEEYAMTGVGRLLARERRAKTVRQKGGKKEVQRVKADPTAGLSAEDRAEFEKERARGAISAA